MKGKKPKDDCSMKLELSHYARPCECRGYSERGKGTK